MRRGVRLRHLNPAGRWPSGRPRYYYRRPGGKNYPLPDADPGDPEFLRAYAEAARKAEVATSGAPGSIAAAIDLYLRSPAFRKLGTLTQGRRRRLLDDFRARYGAAPMRDLRPRHIRKDLSLFEGHAAHARLKAWRHFCKWAHATGGIETNPARDVMKPELPPSEGWTPWTAKHVAVFREAWPIGTPERLFFELAYRTCASVVDLCAMHRGMVEGGFLTYTRSKSGSLAVVPWTDPPDWFGRDDLDACLALHGHLHFVVTKWGRPRSEKAASQWFSRACRVAGLPDGYSAHGVRKYRAGLFRERGATEDQRMAILGHETSSEAERYAKGADLRKIILGTKLPTRNAKIFQLLEKRT